MSARFIKEMMNIIFLVLWSVLFLKYSSFFRILLLDINDTDVESFLTNLKDNL